MTPSPILVRALRWGGVMTVAVAVVGAVIGYLVAGFPGLYGALIGAVLAAVFMGLTAVSILVASRVASGPEAIVVYFGIIMGVWFIKLVVFVILALWLHGQSWLDPGVFGFTVIAAVLGSLVVDVLSFRATRSTYVDVHLPGQAEDSAEKSRSDT
ncbi:MAG TPA: hypothetical protein VHU90_13040 [Galbitalea sp.]|nr:hypothetical protein [Galbitalea sp.]